MTHKWIKISQRRCDVANPSGRGEEHRAASRLLFGNLDSFWFLSLKIKYQSCLDLERFGFWFNVAMTRARPAISSRISEAGSATLAHTRAVAISPSFIDHFWIFKKESDQFFPVTSLDGTFAFCF